MLKFNREEYLENGRKTYELRGEIEALADKLSEQGYQNIILTGVGGTTAELVAVETIIKHYSNVPVYLLNAAEALLQKNKHITKDSIVITASKSGDTKETVAIAEYSKKIGAEVVVFTGSKDSPLGKNATQMILSDIDGMENAYLKLYLLSLRLLYNRGDFPMYEKFADQMANLHTNLARLKEEYDPIASEIGKKYWNEPYQIWVGSDILYGDIYLFTMCILEEMQWMRTKLVSSAEFFHGTLELVDKEVPVFLVKGEGVLRPLDERVERFLEKTTNKLVVIDTKDFKLEGIDDEFRYILSPILFSNVTTGRLAKHYEANSGHDLDYRRYYRQFEY